MKRTLKCRLRNATCFLWMPSHSPYGYLQRICTRLGQQKIKHEWERYYRSPNPQQRSYWWLMAAESLWGWGCGLYCDMGFSPCAYIHQYCLVQGGEEEDDDDDNHYHHQATKQEWIRAGESQTNRTEVVGDGYKNTLYTYENLKNIIFCTLFNTIA